MKQIFVLTLFVVIAVVGVKSKTVKEENDEYCRIYCSKSNCKSLTKKECQKRGMEFVEHAGNCGCCSACK